MLGLLFQALEAFCECLLALVISFATRAAADRHGPPCRWIWISSYKGHRKKFDTHVESPDRDLSIERIVVHLTPFPIFQKCHWTKWKPTFWERKLACFEILKIYHLFLRTSPVDHRRSFWKALPMICMCLLTRSGSETISTCQMKSVKTGTKIPHVDEFSFEYSRDRTTKW